MSDKRFTCINSDHNHRTPEESWACRAATDKARKMRRPAGYLVSQQKLQEALDEANEIEWEKVERRNGKWVWVHE